MRSESRIECPIDVVAQKLDIWTTEDTVAFLDN
jgi:hypothetical protein